MTPKPLWVRILSLGYLDLLALRERCLELEAKVDVLEQDKRLQVQKREACQEGLRKVRLKCQALEGERDALYAQYTRLLQKPIPAEPASSSAALATADESLRQPPVTDPMLGPRLNLGCGTAKKEQAINLDLDVRVKPDVVATLTQPLPFMDESFALVEAYHVIEHVFVWEALDVLKECYRILKPGGTVALECPNIEAACSWLLANGDFGAASQQGMWPLYGDPSACNPFVTHKWGYTPSTLAEALNQAGFRAVRRTRPHSHVAARDMRLEAEKPADDQSMVQDP